MVLNGKKMTLLFQSLRIKPNEPQKEIGTMHLNHLVSQGYTSGDEGSLAVKTSTPVSVTKRVCSN